jgi:MerR family transcriptional regulator, thiopeptide resistance regulator
MSNRDWSIQEIARLSGTTSRTLRHYGEIGLLAPSRMGANGYRYYDESALTRLQRILLLRELGLGLPAIAEALDTQDDAAALRRHLAVLTQEQARLQRQIASVTYTLEREEELMAENMFDGFDHTTYKEEVVERWGADAYAGGDSWWSSMTATEKKGWQARLAQLNADWIAAAGGDPSGEAAQALAKRHAEWLRSIPGTPPLSETYPGDLYVADDRFAKNYGGPDGARFVRDALAIYARGQR